MRRFILAAFATFLAVPLVAQSFTAHPCADTNSGDWSNWLSRNDSVCEVRSTSFPLSGGHLGVKGMNGSIEVLGENRQDVALEAQVVARAPSRGEAEAILHEITINTNGTVEAHGPQSFNGRNWSVNYRLHVPHHLAADLRTENGSLTLADIEGAIAASTTNGSVRLRGLAGDIRAGTTNGSFNVSLDGPAWRGKGLVAHTINGSVSVSVPPAYSAHLEARTVNGRVTVSGLSTAGGDIKRNRLVTDLGQGGPDIDLETVNGSISVH